MPTFTNQATLSYNGLSVASNIATGELVETLTINKTAVSNVYRNGDDVTYVVNLINSGNTDLTNITLTDNLGGYTFNTTTVYPLAYKDGSVRYFSNGVLGAAPAVTAGPPLTITGVTVPANGVATVTYEANLTEFAPFGTTDNIANTVSATGAGLTAPVTANETVTPIQSPDLRINKTINPSVVTAGDTVNYNFLIENYGNTPVTVTDNAIVNDTFNPILTGVTATLDGTALTPTTDYTYSEATGVFSTVPGRITVPAATYTTDPNTGAITVTPGSSTLTVTGTI